MGETKRFFKTGPGVSFLVLLVTLALGVVIGSIVLNGVGANPSEVQVSKLTRKGGGTPLVLDREAPLHEGFARLVETVGPAVVNIRTQGLVELGANMPPDAFREFFGPELFDRFFDQQERPRERKRLGVGSGVIVDSAGYILTNNHVVQQVDKITVTLANNSKYSAEVIGIDRQSDLAVLKIDANEPVPFAKIGDSDTVKVGDWVLALGSPFGLSKTVTAGIVSATGRVGLTEIFGDYIQTDAAINPGNSGGPIVDEKGQLVAVAVAGMSKDVTEGISFGIKSSAVTNFLKTNKISPDIKLTSFSMNDEKVNQLLEESTVYIFCE